MATSFPYTPFGTYINISTTFQLYRSFLRIYQRFFQYIDVSKQNIDLQTSFDTLNAQHTLSPK